LEGAFFTGTVFGLAEVPAVERARGFLVVVTLVFPLVATMAF
jgi:hypothetical protein